MKNLDNLIYFKYHKYYEYYGYAPDTLTVDRDSLEGLYRDYSGFLIYETKPCGVSSWRGMRVKIAKSKKYIRVYKSKHGYKKT